MKKLIISVLIFLIALCGYLIHEYEAVEKDIQKEVEIKPYISLNCQKIENPTKDSIDKCIDQSKESLIKDKMINNDIFDIKDVKKLYRIIDGHQTVKAFTLENNKILIQDNTEYELCLSYNSLKFFQNPNNSIEIEPLNKNFYIICKDKKTSKLIYYINENVNIKEVEKNSIFLQKKKN